MSFFKKLGNSANNVFKKATGGIDTVLRKSINTASKVGGYIEKASPYLTAINPELGSIAGAVGGGLQQGKNILKDVRKGNLTGAIQKSKGLADQYNMNAGFY